MRGQPPLTPLRALGIGILCLLIIIVVCTVPLWMV
jgi:hypothetical protein